MKRFLTAEDLSGAPPDGFKVSRIFLRPDQLVSIDLSNSYKFAKFRHSSGRDERAGVRVMLVKELNLSNNSCLTESELYQLSQLDQDCAFPFLLNVALAQTAISDAFIERLSSRCPNVESIDLTQCANVTDSALVMLAARCTRIHSINVSDCALVSNLGVDFIIERLGANLVMLDVSNSGVRMTQDLCEKITERCFNLRNLNLGIVTDWRFIDAIAVRCKKLKVLDVSRCQIPPKELNDIVAKLPNLKNLNISFNFKINEKNIMQLLNAFPGLQIAAFGFDFADSVLTSNPAVSNRLCF